MSLSGSSASRNSIWAMTRLASSSSMKVGRKMIRSLSSREKMSNARSPRGVCSLTIGTRAITAISLRAHARVLDEHVEGLALAQPVAQSVQVAALFHHTPDRRRRPLTGARVSLDLGLDLGVANRDLFLLADGLQQERSPHRGLGGRPELGQQLAVVQLDPVGIDALTAQTVAGV